MSSPSTALAFPTHEPVPGGVALVPLADARQPRPVVYYGKQLVTVQTYEGQWLAVVGIPLDAQAGAHHLYVAGAGGAGREPEWVEFDVIPKQYRTQRLQIADPTKVNPDEVSTERIVQEMKVQKQLVHRFTAGDAALEFIKPVAGRDSGRFGLRRILNGQPRNPHSGMDIAAPTGTPIHAVSAGQVIFTGEFFFSGKVVYIDHGNGVLTLYAHMDEILAVPGTQVEQGAVIGRVGKTGRTTGAHLHWSVYLNGVAVNPALFL